MPEDQRQACQEAHSHAGRPVSLWRLACIFLRIGATGFGGMIPLLALVHHVVVEKHRLADEEAFAEGAAIGQILPGPIVVDAVTHLGYRLRGGIGALVTTVCFILPAAVLVIVLSPLYFSHAGSPVLTAAMRGVGAVVVGLVVVATFKLGTAALKGLPAVVIAASSFVSLAVTRIPPALIVLVAGLAGMLWLRPRCGPSADTATKPDPTGDKLKP
jgi:chromate transporter